MSDFIWQELIRLALKPGPVFWIQVYEESTSNDDDNKEKQQLFHRERLKSGSIPAPHLSGSIGKLDIDSILVYPQGVVCQFAKGTG